MKLKTQTFNDGVVNIYSVRNTAASGNTPKKGLTLKVGPLRYEERTVGITRFWTGRQAQARIDRLVRTARTGGVTSRDVAVLADGQYTILQVQYPKDTDIPTMDLTLERLEAAYDIT
jgi:hypothetical protein